jgi:hypothetical protein
MTKHTQRCQGGSTVPQPAGLLVGYASDEGLTGFAAMFKGIYIDETLLMPVSIPRGSSLIYILYCGFSQMMNSPTASLSNGSFNSLEELGQRAWKVSRSDHFLLLDIL